LPGTCCELEWCASGMCHERGGYARCIPRASAGSTSVLPSRTGEINRQGLLHRPRPAFPRWRSSERP
jgi:hypothetical protein